MFISPIREGGISPAYLKPYGLCVTVTVYVFVEPPAVTSSVSVSVLAVQVTVLPVNVVPFSLVTTEALALSVVYESESEAFVVFVV